MNRQHSNKWYHGSPQRITSLRKGSTITQNKNLARIFSHNPTIVSISNNGKIRHNGRKAGYLYEVVEFVNTVDVYPHPHSTMPKGYEWLIKRELQVKFVEETRPSDEELLSSILVLLYRLYSKWRKLVRSISINCRKEKS